MRGSPSQMNGFSDSIYTFIHLPGAIVGTNFKLRAFSWDPIVIWGMMIAFQMILWSPERGLSTHSLGFIRVSFG